MKHRIFTMMLLAVQLLAALPLLPSSAVAPAQTAVSDVRIMSANLLTEFPIWSGGTAPRPNSERILDVEKMLNENAPMIVGSQEVSPS